MKVLPLHCKWLDLRVAQMTTQNGGPVSSWRHKKIVSPIGNSYAKYLDAQINVHFFLKSNQELNFTYPLGSYKNALY